MTSEISRAVSEQINYLAQAQAIMTLISRCEIDSTSGQAIHQSALAANDIIAHVDTLRLPYEIVYGYKTDPFVTSQIEQARALISLVAQGDEGADFDDARRLTSDTVSRILRDAVDHLKHEAA